MFKILDTDNTMLADKTTCSNNTTNILWLIKKKKTTTKNQNLKPKCKPCMQDTMWLVREKCKMNLSECPSDDLRVWLCIGPHGWRYILCKMLVIYCKPVSWFGWIAPHDQTTAYQNLYSGCSRPTFEKVQFSLGWVFFPRSPTYRYLTHPLLWNKSWFLFIFL